MHEARQTNKRSSHVIHSVHCSVMLRAKFSRTNHARTISDECNSHICNLIFNTRFVNTNIVIPWPRLARWAFGVRIILEEQFVLHITACPRFAFWVVSKSTFLGPGGSGFALLQRSAHPHCPRQQTLRVCLLWLGQRRRQATVSCNKCSNKF
jgi:hypothetical protein